MFFENAWRCTAICSSHRSSSTSSTWPSPNGNWSHHNWNHWRRHVWRQCMKSKWTADGPPSAGGAGGGGAGFSPSWKIARWNCHLESAHLLNLALPWYAGIAISICFTWYSPGVLVAFHFVQHPTRKTHQTANCKISRWIIYKKGWTDVQRRPDLVFRVSFVPPPNHLLDHRPLQDFGLGSIRREQVRIHRWGSTGDSPSWAPHGRWPLVGVSIQEFLGSEKRSLIRSSYDVNFMMLKQFKIYWLKWFNDFNAYLLSFQKFSALRISLYQDFSRQRRSLTESGRKKWVQESARKFCVDYLKGSLKLPIGVAWSDHQVKRFVCLNKHRFRLQASGACSFVIRWIKLFLGICQSIASICLSTFYTFYSMIRPSVKSGASKGTFLPDNKGKKLKKKNISDGHWF